MKINLVKTLSAIGLIVKVVDLVLTGYNSQKNLAELVDKAVDEKLKNN